MTFNSSGFSAPTVDTVIRNASTELKTTAVGVVVSVDSSTRIISYLPYPNEAGNFVAFANGNTKTTVSGSWLGISSTIAVNKGKFYWEIQTVITEIRKYIFKAKNTKYSKQKIKIILSSENQ